MICENEVLSKVSDDSTGKFCDKGLSALSSRSEINPPWRQTLVLGVAAERMLRICEDWAVMGGGGITN